MSNTSPSATEVGAATADAARKPTEAPGADIAQATPLLGSITADAVGALARLATELGLEEIELQDGGQRIRLRWPSRDVVGSAAAGGPVDAVARAASTALAGGPVNSVAGRAAATAAAGAAATAAGIPAAMLIRAPMAGTFYRAPAPGQPVFVDAGSAVDPDTIVCIIESMKMMNRVEAERGGRIASVLVSNGDRVQIGQPLFALGA